MSSDMLWIVPTRGRPNNVKELIEAWDKTRCYADLLLVVDEDDPEYEGYEKVLDDGSCPSWVSWTVEPRMMLSGKLNETALDYAYYEYRFIGFMGDDHRPRTQLWDSLIAARLRKMGTGFVYGNDLFQRSNLPTSVCMTSDIIRTLGFMIPPSIEHLYVDNFWLEMGRAIQRIEYREDIIIEHVHPHARKAPSDEQYERVNSSEQSNKDRMAFESYKRTSFAGDIQKLKGIL